MQSQWLVKFQFNNRYKFTVSSFLYKNPEMNSYGYSSDRCARIVEILSTLFYSGKELSKSIRHDDIHQLAFSCEKEWAAESTDSASEPMVWIGIYIAIASFLCVLVMAADLLHGFRHKKFWFPCKYFSLNAASITVIAVTMKLPVDLSSGTSSFLDQGSKLGSLAFMCVMMANVMPSLASMDNKTLLANVIGLSVLVITVIVNICIQINTGVILHLPPDIRTQFFHGFDFVMIAYIYVAMILLLLVIMISSSLTIPTCKEILESKYRAANKMSLSDQNLQHIQMSVVQKLRQHVTRYWVMAETGSPQFVMTSNPLSTASGVICVIVMAIHSFMVLTIHFKLRYIKLAGSGSPYKWSTLAIYITQTIGVLVGTIAPISRWFSVFSFKLATKSYMNQFMFFKVEKYYTQKLCEWKQSPEPSLSSSRRLRSIILNSKNIVLSLCIGFQKVIVVSCKVIWLIATVIPVIFISCLYHRKSLKARWFTPSITSGTDDIDEDLSNYVLQINNEMELAEKTLKRIEKAMNSFISKAVNNNLFEFLQKSNGFKGVDNFDTQHVQPLLPVQPVNTWSLPIVTLTCIAVALPNIHKDEIESLVRSVGEGLLLTHLVEESLNRANEYVNIRKTTLILWHEVENKWKWLDNSLAKHVFKGKKSIQIVEWFSDKAKQIVTETKGSTNLELVENPPHALIVANSMYRITQTILLRYQNNIEPITKKQLFAHINGVIADIFSACFTNIPRVITIRCQENVIEKRETSVKVATKLLGKTIKIIERLETLELPSMDDDKMAYIDDWRLYLKQSIP